MASYVADPFLRLSVRASGAVSVGEFLGSLAAVLVLGAVPMMLLRTAAPYANRLAVGRVADTSRYRSLVPLADGLGVPRRVAMLRTRPVACRERTAATSVRPAWMRSSWTGS